MSSHILTRMSEKECEDMRLLIVMISSFCILSACQITQQPKTVKEVNMYLENGDKSGTASLKEDPDGVEIRLKLKGLTPGYHGLHLHEKAACKGPKFKQAGNHFNPDDKEHGLLYPKGPHVGDLKNIEADKHGEVDTKVIAEDTSLLTEKGKSLTAGEGTSLIVTSEADDGMTQISGNSGDRIICGEIKTKDSDK